jgi:hypothetical protein
MLASVRKWAKARATGSAAATGISARRPARASKSPSDPARARFGKGTHVLDEGEDGAPLASDERLAQQFAEQAHVVSERTVGIVLVHAAV